MGSVGLEAAGRLGVGDEDIAHMRAVRRKETVATSFRLVGYVLAGFAGAVGGVLLASPKDSVYPFAIPVAAMAVGGGLRPRWKTPLLLAVSFFVGLSLMALSSQADIYSEGTYYGAFSRSE